MRIKPGTVTTAYTHTDIHISIHTYTYGVIYMDYLEELKQRNQWVNYVITQRNDGSAGKPPINPHTLRNASTTDPDHWTDYKTAAGRVGSFATFTTSEKEKQSLRVAGTGVIMTGGYCGIDLDHVVEDGKIKAPFVMKLVSTLDTYTEFSISGTGLHLLMFADNLPSDLGGKFHVDGEGNLNKNGKYIIEVYAYKNGGGRYLTVSENVFHNRPINHEVGDKIQKIYDYYTAARTQPKEQPTPSPVGSNTPPERSDEEVLNMALRYDYDGSFKRLYEGDLSMHGNDHSTADLAFVNKLKSWTNGDRGQIDRIFRNSGLMREKWDRPMSRGSEKTYGQQTIDKALENFTPYRRSEDNELSIDDVKQAVAEASQKAADNSQIPNVPDVNARELSRPEPKEEKKQLTPLTYDNAVGILQNANDERIEIPCFESFAKQAKIGQHDTVIIAGETGSGKSMLALNLMENLNQKHAVLYFNLEMTKEMVLRRMVAIHSDLELDMVEGYKLDTGTQGTVNAALKEITNREPIYVENDRYKLEEIEDAIKQAVAIQESRGRKEPVIAFVDHVLLLRNVGKTASQYERYSRISEELRRIAVLNNCIIFVLTQQSRAGKADKENEPELSSLKESGSFENDATHVTFVWKGVDGYYLVLRKNRKGESETKWKLDIDFARQIVKATGEGLPLRSISDIENIEFNENTNSRPTRKGKKKPKAVNDQFVTYSGEDPFT